MLVVGIEGDPRRGYWGEVLTMAVQARGAAGLVIDGCVRDTAAVAARVPRVRGGPRSRRDEARAGPSGHARRSRWRHDQLRRRDRGRR